MAFDAFVLHAVKTDLEKNIVQNKLRIHRITQLNSTDILIEFRGPQTVEPLFISISPDRSRIHFTSRHYSRPQSPPAFCMLLRKHLTGGQLISLEQPPLERIMYLHFLATNEQGRETRKTLVAEIMGRHSNLILTSPRPESEGPFILGCLKPVPPAINRYRAVLPNHTYFPPPLQEKLHPFALNYDYFHQEILQNQGKKVDQFFLQNFQGFSPFLAREVASRAGVFTLSPDSAPVLWEKMQELMELYQVEAWQPTMLHNAAGQPEDFCAFRPQQALPGHTRLFSSMSKLLDEFFQYKEKNEEKHNLYRLLSQQVQRNLQKSQRKEKKQRKELENTQKAEEYRLYGELIYMNLKNIPEKSSQVEVKNVFDEHNKTITIPLDPSISPSQNAQRYFKKYRKARQGTKEITRQLESTRQEIQYLESVLYSLEKADIESMREIREELIETGYIAIQKPGSTGKKQSAAKPLQYISSQGETILVGRNNRQNDYLSLRLAAKTDYWLHAKNMPGAHVIVRSSEPHEETLKEAALLAAYYSRGSSSSNVPIDYTRVKNLRKIPGPMPGMVTYSKYKTIYVTPEEQVITNILSRPFPRQDE